MLPSAYLMSFTIYLYWWFVIRLRTIAGQFGSNFESDSSVVISSRQTVEFDAEERPRAVNAETSARSLLPTNADAACGRSATLTELSWMVCARWRMLRATGGGRSGPRSFRFLAFRFRRRSFRLWASIREVLSVYQSEGIMAHLGNRLLLVPASCFRYYWVGQYSLLYSLLHESHSKEDLQRQHLLQQHRQGTPQ